MFSNYCCCCLKISETLLPMTGKCSTEDNKVFLDYYNYIFREFLNESNSLDFICLRCSKALQVTYHFINMIKENKKTSFFHNNRETFLDDASFKEMQDSPSTSDNKVERYKLNTKCEVICGTSKSDLSSNEFISLSSRKVFEENRNDSYTDFMCIICDELFETKLSFFEHNRENHKEIVPYKCKLCSFYTCYTESLFKHCEKNHGLTDVAIDSYQTKMGITYFCIPCNFKFCDQTRIDEHLAKEHSIEEDMESFVKEIFHCPLCYRSFAALKSLKIHYSMYHKCSSQKNSICSKRKFSCEKCGKLFDLKSGLFLHRRICEERKPVACNFCKLQYTSVLTYERHLQDMHSVAIRYECEICGKAFRCSEYLTVHRKRHNERYYQCELCPKNYINNADLKVHKQRIHAIRHTPTWATSTNFSFLKFNENKK